MTAMFRRFLNLCSRSFSTKTLAFELVPQPIMPHSGDTLFAAFRIKESMIQDLPQNMILACLPHDRPTISDKIDLLQNEIGIINGKINQLEHSHYNMLVGNTAIGLTQFFHQLEAFLITENLPSVVVDLLGERRLQFKEFSVAKKKNKENKLISEEMSEFLNVEAVKNLEAIMRSVGFGHLNDFRNMNAHPFITQLNEFEITLLTLKEKYQLLSDYNKEGLALCETYFEAVKKVEEKMNEAKEKQEQMQKENEKNEKKDTGGGSDGGTK